MSNVNWETFLDLGLRETAVRSFAEGRLDFKGLLGIFRDDGADPREVNKLNNRGAAQTAELAAKALRRRRYSVTATNRIRKGSKRNRYSVI